MYTESTRPHLLVVDFEEGGFEDEVEVVPGLDLVKEVEEGPEHETVVNGKRIRVLLKLEPKDEGSLAL